MDLLLLGRARIDLRMVPTKPGVVVRFLFLGFISLGSNNGLAPKKVWFSLVPLETGLGAVGYRSDGSSSEQAQVVVLNRFPGVVRGCTTPVPAHRSTEWPPPTPSPSSSSRPAARLRQRRRRRWRIVLLQRRSASASQPGLRSGDHDDLPALRSGAPSRIWRPLRLPFYLSGEHALVDEPLRVPSK
jgi:hypothetical protein